MRYNEIIHVNQEFVPVVDLENEKDQYWSLFIPNNKFRDILNATINSLDNPAKYNPVWLQGTYGTGKTHATSVIKHLLCDNEIDFDLGDKQLSAKLNKFREKNKVFPVVLKGTSSMGNSDKLKLKIQKVVKNTLKNNEMDVNIQSDFENMVSLLKDGVLNIENDTKGTILEFYDKNEIVRKLENNDWECIIILKFNC